jgi:hypothetical protein
VNTVLPAAEKPMPYICSLVKHNQTSSEKMIRKYSEASQKVENPSNIAAAGVQMVAWGRIELPTRGFSIRCSTN